MSVDNRVSLYKLEVFCRVIELGGISRAGEYLRIAQPAVTAHVRSLEKRLGVKLLYRSGRSVYATEAGECVYRWASDVATSGLAMEREIGELADGTKGSVAVATSMSAGNYIIPGILADFATERTGARITMFASDPQEAAEATKKGICDFGVVITDELEAENELLAERLGVEELVLVTGPDGEPTSNSVTLGELPDIPFVCPPSSLMRRRMEERQLWKLGVSQRRVVIELGHPEAMKTAAQRGLGVAMLFRSAVQHDLDAGSLREIRIKDHSMALPILLIRRRDKFLSPLQQALYDMVKEHVTADQQEESYAQG